MDFKIIPFNDAPPQLWDRWVAQMPEASYLHSHAFLSFLHEVVPPANVLTFACIENEAQPVALCPLGVCTRTLDGCDYKEASWNGAPLGAPAFRAMSPSARRKAQNAVIDLLHARMVERGVERSCLRRHAITVQMLSGSTLDPMQFSLLQNGYQCLPQNTVIVDLRKPEDALLADMSEYQRKHIRRSQKNGLIVRECAASDAELHGMFARYQSAHAQSAGGLTRPQKSFDIMLALIEGGKARLFVSFLRDTPLSFLYCGEFNGFAFGWSQANIDEFEREYSPRHLLEWQTMLAYKRRGFTFYEVGTLWHGPQPYKIPTPKEISIAEFKRRYGGLLLPELCFEKFFSKELWTRFYEHRKESFLSSDYFSSPTNEIP